jgi:ABC-type glucose/galactose transport system permease subunit
VNRIYFAGVVGGVLIGVVVGVVVAAVVWFCCTDKDLD